MDLIRMRGARRVVVAVLAVLAAAFIPSRDASALGRRPAVG